MLSVFPIVIVASLTGFVSSLPGFLMAVLGLGLIILIHEFGHFAAAKACDVYVEAFAIGFGPAIVAKKYGETEYRLNLLPLGGYVKMLGQDDMDSTQMTSEEVAENPRAYSAKTVPQRMLIISAGVIMNVLTAVLFYAAAFGIGIGRTAPLVGSVQAPKPGWVANFRPGDRISSINGRPVANFTDIFRGTALSNGAIEITGTTVDGSEFSKTIEPMFGGERRMIGVGPMRSNELLALSDSAPARFGTPAADSLKNPVESKTFVTAVNGQPVSSYSEMIALFEELRAEPVTLTIEDGNGSSNEVSLEPMPFKTFGMSFDIGKVVAIQNGSVAEAEKIQVGDRLAKVDGLEIGKDLDPMRLSDYLSERAGETVSVQIVRQSGTGEQTEVEISLTPDDRSAWESAPLAPLVAQTIPSLGLAFEVIPSVLTIDADGPAAKAGLERGDKILAATMTAREGFEEAVGLEEAISFQIGTETLWPYIFWFMQTNPGVELEVSFQDKSEDAVKTAKLTLAPTDDWWLPTTRGLVFNIANYDQKAASIGSAFSLALNETGDKVTEIYMTLRALFTGNVGVKGLRGPIGILGIAKDVAEAGISPFLTFLGYISVNLAVLNFLPIPVLDGGHMILLAYEGIFRKKPSEKFVIAVTQIGLLALMGLFLMVTFFDFGRLF